MKKIALFGYNNIAQRHLAGLKAVLGEDMAGRIVVAGRNTDKARDMTRQYGTFPIYEDWRELLAREKPELVVVATPNFLHREMAVASLQSGAHVLCEKPLGTHSDQVRDMYSAARDARRFLIPAMSTRHSENARLLSTSIKAHNTIRFMRGEASYMRARHIPGAIGFLKKDQAGGGVLLDLGVHVLDIALWLWSGRITEVRAKTHVDPAELEEDMRLANDYGEELDLSEMDVEYEAHAILTFEDGGTLALHVSWASKDPSAVRGKDADSYAPFVRLTTEDGKMLRWDFGSEPSQLRYTRQIEHALRVITGAEDMLVGEEEMVRMHRVIDAMYLSAAQNGTSVALQ